MRSLYLLTGMSIILTISGCFGPSHEEIENYANSCVKFYERERAHDKYVEYRNNWMKNDQLVISLAVKTYKGADRYTEGLCVVDFKEGTLHIPSLLNEEKWKK